ncbi:MAG: hypothetical protein IJD04_04920 [Desulfovibrionaceae bacterium]|nr:hypothetical protein [Desulfovibrionaceae bacterium]
MSRAVYGLSSQNSESEIVAGLFKRYEQLIEQEKLKKKNTTPKTEKKITSHE